MKLATQLLRLLFENLRLLFEKLNLLKKYITNFSLKKAKLLVKKTQL